MLRAWCRSPLRLCALALLWCLLLSVQTRADDAAQERASAHFDRGVQLVEEGSYEQAVIEFERAHAMSGSDEVLYNLGMTYVAVGRPAEALQALTRYLQRAERVSDDERARIEAELARQRAQVGSLEVRALPSGARILVDGRERGVAPLREPLILSRGDHWVEVSQQGYQPMLRTVTVGSVAALIYVQLSPALAATAPVARAAAASPLAPPPRPPVRRWMTPVGYALGGVGIALGAGALSAYLISDQRQARSAALGLTIAGAACLVAGTALLWLGKRRARQAERRVALAPNAAGVRLMGRF